MDVNKLFVFKSLLTMPSNVLPLHLKQTFPLIIWIFTEGEGDGTKSRLSLKIFSTLSTSGKLHNPPDTSICGRILEQDWGNQIQLCQLEHHRSYFLCLPLHICLGRYFIRQLSTPIYKLFGPHIQSGSLKVLYFPHRDLFRKYVPLNFETSLQKWLERLKEMLNLKIWHFLVVQTVLILKIWFNTNKSEKNSKVLKQPLDKIIINFFEKKHFFLS